jgi:hypothetical protein
MKTHPFNDQQSMGKSTAEIGGAVAFVWDIGSIETF